MSETPKRRRGDRRDAVLLRETDALHFIMGIIYPHRADNEAYIAERIDLEPIKAYLAKKNVEGIEFKYTFFHVIVAALVKTITLRPKLNRFYANENYYQRNKVTAGFIIKKEFSADLWGLYRCSGLFHRRMHYFLLILEMQINSILPFSFDGVTEIIKL